MKFTTRGKLKIAIVGGSTVFQESNTYYTKGQFAYYLEKLNETYEVLWFSKVQSIIPFEKKVPEGIKYKMLKLKNLGDLIHVKLWILFLPQSYRYIPLIFLAKALNIKIITYSGTDFDVEICVERSWLRKILRKTIRHIAIKYADLVLVRGERAMKFAKKINMNCIVSHPINTPPKSNWVPTGNKIFNIIFVGKLQKSKGIFELCQCVSELSQEGYKLKFNIIGSGVDQQEIKSRYGNPDIKNIIFHGWVDERKKIDELICKADLAVFPSQQYGPEGVPRVIEEALVIGVPILITPHPAFLENNLHQSVAMVAKGFNSNDLKCSIMKWLVKKNKPFRNKKTLPIINASTQHVASISGLLS